MATDTFSGSGNLGGGNWTVVTGSFNQASGLVHGNAGGASSYAVWTADSFSDDQYAEVVLTPRGSGQYIGPAVRCASGAFTCANVDAGADGLYMSTFSGGSQTVLPGYPVTCPPVNTVIRLEATGNQLKLYFDGVLQDTQTPAGLPASGRPGITAYSNGSFTGATSWTGDSLGGSATETAVDIDAVGALNAGGAARTSSAVSQAAAGLFSPRAAASSSAAVGIAATSSVTWVGVGSGGSVEAADAQAQFLPAGASIASSNINGVSAATVTFGGASTVAGVQGADAGMAAVANFAPVGASAAAGAAGYTAAALARFKGADASAPAVADDDDDEDVRRIWRDAAEAEQNENERLRIQRIARYDDQDLAILSAALAAAVAETRTQRH